VQGCAPWAKRSKPTWSSRVSASAPDWSPVARRIRDEATDTWDDQVAVDRLVGIHGPGNDGFLKVIAADGVLVGATSAGPAGGEVLGALSLAVHATIPVPTLPSSIWAYPTFHRGILDALNSLK
jgi:hypothetical protein